MLHRLPLADHCDYHERSCTGPGPSRRRSGGLRGCRHWDGHGQRQHWWVSSVRHGYKCEQRQPWSIGASRNRDTRRWYRCKPEPHQSNQQPGRSTHHVEVAGGGEAKRTACAGHAQNGLPIGAFGTGTSNEEQMIVGPSPNRKIPAAKVDGNIAGIVGRGSSLSDQVSRPRAARTGEKVLDAAGRQSASPTANDSFA